MNSKIIYDNKNGFYCVVDNGNIIYQTFDRKCAFEKLWSIEDDDRWYEDLLTPKSVSLADEIINIVSCTIK